MPIATVDGIRVHYEERGSGRPLLLVHGFPLDSRMWVGQWETLAKQHRVIAPDLRGFGSSDVTPGTVTMERFADDLAGLLAALSIREPVIVCGLSMGGYIAWQFWRRHGDRLAGLILCDTRAVADSPEAAQGRRATAEQVLSQGPQPFVDNLISKLFSKETVRSRLEVVEQTRQVMLETAPEGIAAALRGMAERPDVTLDLPRIAVPTLVICGEHDVISPPEEMSRIASAIRGARFELVPNAGHMAPLEQAVAVNRAIGDFLCRVVG